MDTHPQLPRVFFVLFCFLRYAGLSLLWPLPLRSTGSGRAGSVAMAHGPNRSTACGIFPERGTNPRPLHRQADSQPLRHQGSPKNDLFLIMMIIISLFHSFSPNPEHKITQINPLVFQHLLELPVGYFFVNSFLIFQPESYLTGHIYVAIQQKQRGKEGDIQKYWGVGP